MAYLYTIYNFQDADRSAASQEKIDAMEADGWQVHTATPGYTELMVLWHKPAPMAEALMKGERVLSAPGGKAPAHEQPELPLS